MWNQDKRTWHASFPPSGYPAQIIPSVTFTVCSNLFCRNHKLHISLPRIGTITSFTAGSYVKAKKWRIRLNLDWWSYVIFIILNFGLCSKYFFFSLWNREKTHKRVTLITRNSKLIMLISSSSWWATIKP